MKASGGTSFSPGDFPFAKFRTANLTLSYSIRWFMTSNVLRGLMSSRASQVMGRSAVYTHSKCGARTEEFPASIVVMVPSGKRMRMMTCLTWWLSLPPTNTRTAFFHACLLIYKLFLHSHNDNTIIDDQSCKRDITTQI